MELTTEYIITTIPKLSALEPFRWYDLSQRADKEQLTELIKQLINNGSYYEFRASQSQFRVLSDTWIPPKIKIACSALKQPEIRSEERQFKSMDTGSWGKMITVVDVYYTDKLIAIESR